MITDVPTPDDFKDAGLAYLNLAWGQALGLMMSLDDMAAEASSDEETVPDGYWEAAQKPLAAALALIQQGTELIIKGKIADVSPFLLISGRPDEWPSDRQSCPIPFSEFKTLDAKDLVRAHNTAGTTPFSSSFTQDYEQRRRLRNIIMHSVDPTVRITAKSVLTDLLSVHAALTLPQTWLVCRRAYLEQCPDSVAYYDSSDYTHVVMVHEFSKILDVMQPSAMREYFGINKRQRFYFCNECYWPYRDFLDVPPRSAQLSPNTSTSTSVRCFICGKTHSVERRSCSNTGCRGNVIGEDGICLTCFETVDD